MKILHFEIKDNLKIEKRKYVIHNHIYGEENIV